MHSSLGTSERDVTSSCIGTLSMLPAEIRKSIYDYYFFTDDTICRIFQPSRQDPSEEWIIPTIFPSCSHTNPLRGSLKGLALLLTCRQVYDEASEVLFSQSEFHFNDLCALKKFLLVTAPAQLELIRTVRLDWVSFVWFDCGCRAVSGAYIREYWEPVCERLSRMQGLRTLHISIASSRLKGQGRGKVGCDMVYLEPLKHIKAPNFVLEL